MLKNRQLATELKAVTEHQSRAGMTVVELLVVLTVIAVLLALILPAVQSSRESSRRLRCAANLSNIGRALQGYETVRRRFPTAQQPPFKNGDSWIARFHSPHFVLLPHLEQSALFNQIDPNLQQPFWRYDVRTPDIPDSVLSVAGTPVDVFRCPSDAGEFGNNYRFCAGSDIWFVEHTLHGYDPTRAGLFMALEEYSAADIRDGLSNTIGVSEKRKSDVGEEWDAETDFWWTGLSSISGDWPTREEILDVCRALSGTPPSFHPSTGGTWFLSTFAYASYNHAAPPNAPFADASIEPYTRRDQLPGAGVYKASSRHSGGVNCLFMDGSVRFFSDSVDLDVWRSLATRAGGEVRG